MKFNYFLAVSGVLLLGALVTGEAKKSKEKAEDEPKSKAVSVQMHGAI